ncbi:MAG: nickel-dependent hydrogenase large subunit [Candidatus Dormibacteria bacterium]
MTQVAAPVAPALPQTTSLVISPVNRVAGGLSLRVDLDATRRRYTGARLAPGRFRGFEDILEGRDVRDAIYIASRCCGYHGGQHAVAAAQAVEMALDVTPPPMAIALRNLGLAAETVHAEAAHLFLLALPDFSAAVLGAKLPDVLAAAARTPAAHAEVHGYATVAEIMASLDPVTGRWYRDAFGVARIPYAMYAVLHGKYPHPQTMVPGGVATTMSGTTVSAVHDYVVRLLSLVDPAKRVAMMVTDLLEFMAAVPGVAEIGVSPANLIDCGQWDDPEGYDPSAAGLRARGERRWGAPGAVVDGQLVTSDLAEVAAGVEEQTGSSFLASGKGSGAAARLLSRPGATDWEGRYSWCASPRWRGHVMETGPGALLWTTALRGGVPHRNPFVGAEGGAVQLLLPEGGQGGLPEMLLEWRPPQVWNAIERTRARLLGVIFAALAAAQQSITVLDLQKQGRHRTSVPFELPQRGQRQGMGFAGDGFLGHWMSLEGGLIHGYRVIAPSTFNLGPGGAAELAIEGTPVLAAEAAGDEALVALRSFDPCGNCATH